MVKKSRKTFVLVAICIVFFKTSICAMNNKHDELKKDKFREAIINDNEKVVMKFLRTNKNLVNLKTDSGGTPLFIAISKGYENLCKILIENGANVNYECSLDGLCITPLCAAIVRKNENIVKILIENGANLMQRCGSVKTPQAFIELLLRDAKKEKQNDKIKKYQEIVNCFTKS